MRFIIILLLLVTGAYGQGRSLKAGVIVPYTYSLGDTLIHRTIVSGSVYNAVDPATGYLNTYTVGPITCTDYQIDVEYGVVPPILPTITYTSSNPAFATVDTTGSVAYVAHGHVWITGSSQFWSSSIDFDMGTYPPDVSSTFAGFAPGSLAYAIDTSLDSYLTGTGSEEVCKFFTSTPTSGSSVSTADDSTVYYTRNSSLWATGTTFNLTGISIWNTNSTWSERSDGLDMLGGTLLTPQHVISCQHYHWNVGDVLMFVTSTGSVVHRTLTAVAQVGNTDGFLGRLDSPVPSSLHVYSVLPTNFLNYVKSHTFKNVGVMGVCVAQAPVPGDNNLPDGHLKNLYAVRVYPGADALVNIFDSIAYYGVNTDYLNSTRATYALPRGYAVSGDSGEPAFLVIDGELVFVGCFFGPYGSSNSCILSIHDKINAMISGTGVLATSGTTYTLRDHNMSNWPTY